MGKMAVLAGVAALAVLSLSAGAAPAVNQPGQVAAHHEHLLPVELADEAVSSTSPAQADPVVERWPSCQISMNINYAAGPGVNPETMRRELEYPVRYLQNLGYSAAIGNEVSYTKNASMPSGFGEILVVATNDTSEQPLIGTYRGWAVTGNEFSTTPTGLILLDAGRGLSSLVLLHEIGHILGLAHKDGTVMSANGTDSDRYDAAETAAVDCRPKTGDMSGADVKLEP